MVLAWVYVIVFLVAALIIDRFVPMGAGARQIFRIVVLVVGILWALRLLGFWGRLGV